jgi:hypothetical protein
MRDWRIVAGVAAAIGVVIGLGLGTIFGKTAREDSLPSADPLHPMHANSKAPEQPRQTDGQDASPWLALREELAREKQARAWLAEEVDLLWQELERIDKKPAPSSPIAATPEPASKPPKANNPGVQFDDARLAASGVAPDEIEHLRISYDAMQLDELYLHNQASREGWLRSGRYKQDAKNLKEGLRDDLGEEDYDRMLYATGQTNRVRVQAVIGDSPAQYAGLLAGDVILRYADERIFNPRELRSRTTQGVLGKPVYVDVLRNGAEISLSLPRGPLGVKIEPDSLPPR